MPVVEEKPHPEETKYSYNKTEEEKTLSYLSHFVNISAKVQVTVSTPIGDIDSETLSSMPALKTLISFIKDNISEKISRVASLAKEDLLSDPDMVSVLINPLGYTIEDLRQEITQHSQILSPAGLNFSSELLHTGTTFVDEAGNETLLLEDEADIGKRHYSLKEMMNAEPEDTVEFDDEGNPLTDSFTPNNRFN